MKRTISKMIKGENMIKKLMIICAAVLLFAGCETGTNLNNSVEKQANGGQCATSSQCQDESECLGGICVAVEENVTAAGCRSFEDCADGEMCELTTGECVAKEGAETQDEEKDDNAGNTGSNKKKKGETGKSAAKEKELKVTTYSITDATVGKAFELTLTADNGSEDYTWKDVSEAILCEGVVGDCDNTYKKLPKGLSLSGNTISGTPLTTGTYHVVLEVTDNETGAIAHSQPIDMKVLDENDVNIKLKLIDSDKKETDAGTSDITVPFGSKLTAKISNKDYYNASVSHSDDLKLVHSKDENSLIIAIKPKTDVTEVSDVTLTVSNHAGQEKSITISKITFEDDPCAFEIVMDGDADTENVQKAFGDPGVTFKIEGGDENANYTWKIVHSIKFNDKITDGITASSEECFVDDGHTPVSTECNTGKFTYKFTKDFSDKTAGESVDFTDTITMKASSNKCEKSISKSFKLHMASPNEEKVISQLKAKVKMDYWSAETSDYALIRVYNKENTETSVGETDKLAFKDGDHDNHTFQSEIKDDNTSTYDLRDLGYVGWKVKDPETGFFYYDVSYRFDYIMIVSEHHYLYLFNGWDVYNIGTKSREYEIGQEMHDGTKLLWKLRCNIEDEFVPCDTEDKD